MIDVRTILEYYAVLTLATMPVSVFVMISLYKKTSVFEKIDKLIDRMLGIQAPGVNKPEGGNNEPKPEEEKSSVPAPTMTLTVGDIYFCHPFGAPLQEKEWSSDNEFVGNIEDENIFHARHAGRTKILSTVKGQQFDNGNVEYELEVLPMEKWFADSILRKVCDGARMAEVVGLFANRQTSLRPGREDILQLNAGKNENGLMMQFKNGRFVRCLYLVRKQDDRENLEENLQERFEQVELKECPKWFTLWKTGERNEEKDLVPVYAFTHRLNGRETLLGIGRTWREKEDVDEFLMNVGMTVRLFAELSPITSKIQLTAKVERPETKDKKTKDAAESAEGNRPEKTEERKEHENQDEGNDAGTYYGEHEPSELPDDDLDGEIGPDNIGDEYDEDLNGDDVRTSDEFENFSEEI